MSDYYRTSRLRLWNALWIIAVVWLLTLMGLSSGLVNFWVFAGVSVGCFFGAYAVNLRMVRISRRIENGMCWKCGYRLDGIESTNCPECGSAI